MKLVTLSAALLTAACLPAFTPAPAQAVAQALDQDTADQIARVSQSLDRTEERIGDIEPGDDERRIASILRSLDRDSSRLAGLDQGVAEVSALVARISDLRSRLEAATAAAGSAAAGREADQARLEAWRSSGRTREDDQFVRVAERLAGEVKFMDLRHAHLMRPDGIVEQYVRFAENYPPTQDRIDQILQDYADMDPRDVRAASGPALAMLVQEGGPVFQEASARLEAFGAPALDHARGLIAEAERTAAAALEGGRAGDLVGNRAIEGALAYLDNVERIYNARPDADSGVTASFAALQRQADRGVRDRLRQALAIVVAGNDPVRNDFRGGDRATVERMVRERWASAYPDDEILQVRISQSDWVRRREPGWRDGILIMFDYSIITPWVVVAEADGMASQWGMVAEKDHTQGDRISISFGRPRTSGLDPRYTVLQSNLD
ncbi:MAG: hypothetical protein NXI12_14340 [Alphaproteobacteria bacterium]|nr:hypothetical protein [Alphaproteobacteria bacterium]